MCQLLLPTSLLDPCLQVLIRSHDCKCSGRSRCSGNAKRFCMKHCLSLVTWHTQSSVFQILFYTIRHCLLIIWSSCSLSASWMPSAPELLFSPLQWEMPGQSFLSHIWHSVNLHKSVIQSSSAVTLTLASWVWQLGAINIKYRQYRA